MLEKFPDVLTFNDCKKILRVGKNTMLDLIHNKEIEAFKIGNKWKILKVNVIEYLKYK